MNIVVGTAGHIDHGKTALVKALSGIDADRLPEEKRRGITVDLGFAEMTIGDDHFAFVDVPGHERFVKNMLAGASGVRLVLLVIAADEGVMPQTREHFDICRLLRVNSGIVVLTKTDLVDADTLDLAKLDAAELIAGSFLEAAPVVAVSSRTGDGIDDLKNVLIDKARVPARTQDNRITRLPIDRSFSMKGFGAVVTGTLTSGEIAEGADLELLPLQEKVRVRGLQTHGRVVKSAHAGQRVAVNLGGIDHTKIVRGMSLVEPKTIEPSQIVDVEIEVLSGVAKSLRTRRRVRVSLGTSETLARLQVLNGDDEIAAGEKDFAQLRFETPVVTVPGERFIIRSYSPQMTIAGGVVIDALAARHRRRELPVVREILRDLLAAENNDAEKVALLIKTSGAAGSSLAELQARTGVRRVELQNAVDAAVSSGSIIAAGEKLVTNNLFAGLTQTVEDALHDFHKKEPLAKGISRESLREKTSSHLPTDVFNTVIARLYATGKIDLDKDAIRLARHRSELNADESAVSERILASYVDAGLEPLKLDDALADAIKDTRFSRSDARKFFQLHLDSAKIVKVTDEFYFGANEIDALKTKLRDFAEMTNDRQVDVAKFKELAGVSRKYAIPLLEYFDREKITRRSGDKRLIL